VLPKDVPEMTAQTTIYVNDRPQMRARTQAAFDTLLKNPMVDASRIALTGYCFGGAVGVEFGSTGAPLVTNVSIHGSFRDHAAGWAKNAKGMYLSKRSWVPVPLCAIRNRFRIGSRRTGWATRDRGRNDFPVAGAE